MPPKDWTARPCAILNFARCRRSARNRDAAARSASSCGRITGGSTSSAFITGGFIGTALVPFSLAALLWVDFLRPTPVSFGAIVAGYWMRLTRQRRDEEGVRVEGGGGGKVEGERFVRMEGRSPRFGGRLKVHGCPHVWFW